MEKHEFFKLLISFQKDAVPHPVPLRPGAEPPDVRQEVHEPERAVDPLVPCREGPEDAPLPVPGGVAVRPPVGGVHPDPLDGNVALPRGQDPPAPADVEVRAGRVPGEARLVEDAVAVLAPLAGEQAGGVAVTAPGKIEEGKSTLFLLKRGNLRYGKQFEGTQ